MPHAMAAWQLPLVLLVLPLRAADGDALGCACAGKFRQGERVAALQDISGLVGGGPVRGQRGVVVAAGWVLDPKESILVEWDNWSEGHNGHCQEVSCGDCKDSGTSRWWTQCDQIGLEDSTLQSGAAVGPDTLLLDQTLQVQNLTWQLDAEREQLRQLQILYNDSRANAKFALAKKDQQMQAQQALLDKQDRQIQALKQQLQDPKQDANGNVTAGDQAASVVAGSSDELEHENQQLERENRNKTGDIFWLKLTLAVVLLFSCLFCLASCLRSDDQQPPPERLKESLLRDVEDPVLFKGKQPPSKSAGKADLEDLSPARCSFSGRFEPRVSVYDFGSDGRELRCVHLEAPGSRPGSLRSVTSEVEPSYGEGVTRLFVRVQKVSDVPSGARAVNGFDIQSGQNSADSQGSWEKTFAFPGYWEVVDEEGKPVEEDTRYDEHGVLKIHLRPQGPPERRRLRSAQKVDGTPTYRIASTEGGSEDPWFFGEHALDDAQPEAEQPGPLAPQQTPPPAHFFQQPASAQQAQQASSICCPDGHPLQSVGIRKDTWACNEGYASAGCAGGAGDIRLHGTNCYRCPQCDYDLCESCHQQKSAA